MRTPPPQREKACGAHHVIGEKLQMEQFDFTKNEEKLGVQFIREVSLSYKIPSGKRKEKTFVSGPDRAADFIRRVLPDNVREHFMALYLDGSHSVVAFSVVATGGARYCPVIPREVFQPAVLVGACAIVVAHNHPSESTTPSKEDKDTTIRLVDAGKLLCIPILDHILIAGEEHVSLRETDSHLFVE